ncbi:MAG: TonB-dependent receptor [Rhodanobacter sp.]
MKLRYSALYIAMTAVLFSSGAYAADTSTTPSTQAGSQKVKNLATVEVTATKRKTPLQKTPVAITAISGDTLDKERVMTVQDITKLVPGLQGTSEGDHGVVTLTLRGIGNDSAKTEYADPEVAVFVDGVYAPRAEAASSMLLDMDNVEVLRGPQGTLWGRNSTAGAINFQTMKPDINGGFNGNGTIELGSYSQSGVRAAVNLPISSTFAVRVAAAHEQHDGYVNYQNPVGQIPSLAQQQTNYLAAGGSLATFQPINTNLFVQTGQKYSAQDQSATRISTRWKPNDNFRWDLSYEYFKDTGTPDMNLMQQPRAGQDFWSALVDTAPYLNRTSKSVHSRMDWTINDGMELSYIAGFSHYSGQSNFDQDGGVNVPTSFTTGGVSQSDRTNSSKYASSSHELDLKSTGDNTVDWILGAYYEHENNSIRFDIPILNGTTQGTVNWQGSFVQPKELVTSTAAFGQATWHMGDSWNLTAGARWSHDKRQNIDGINWGWANDPAYPAEAISPGELPGNAGFSVSQHNDAKYTKSEPTWLVRIDHNLSANSMVYASVSTGFKSGGTQDGGALYKPETLTNYEIGAKFSFLDGHLTWNSAAYHEAFKNYQLSAPITYTNGAHGLGFVNVGGTTQVTGFESEFAYAQGNDRANLVLSIIPKKKLGTEKYAGSNDYHIAAVCPAGAPLGVSNCLDITGNTLPHAPNFSLTAIYEHDFVLANGGRLTPRVSAQYQSAQWLSWFNFGAGDTQKAYARGDVSLRYTEPNDKWYVNAYVQNVADDRIKSSAAGSTLLANNTLVFTSQYLPPRTYGVQFGFWF